MEYQERLVDAIYRYRESMKKVKNTPAPPNQKFPCGTRVRVTKDLGSLMSHFESDCDATVMYTYAHAYGGDDVKSYCLDIDGIGEVAWYEEWQLKEKP